ncbi:MAG: hypothetical protein ACRDQ2_14160 [Gaiellales bacterium]
MGRGAGEEVVAVVDGTAVAAVGSWSSSARRFDSGSGSTGLDDGATAVVPGAVAVASDVVGNVVAGGRVIVSPGTVGVVVGSSVPSLHVEGHARTAAMAPERRNATTN